MAISTTRRGRGILFLLVFLSLKGVGFAGFVSDQIPERIELLTVELSGQNGESGTGVIVGTQEDGKGVIVLTAAHVLEGAQGISVHFSSGEVREAELLYANREMDYALLGAAEIPLPSQISYPDHRRTVGSDLFVVGYSGLFHYAVSHGIVSNYVGNIIRTDAQASFGSSGSGVWDPEGRLIGLVIQVYVEEVESGPKRYFMQRQTVAVDILRIRVDLKDHGFKFLE
jgi:S1-C subfamily serine protease